ncbi:MAG: hypothetical protein PHG06_21880 [Parabacteroides sp.]|nr:hypothetical protein [Parabacteroides sp.]
MDTDKIKELRVQMGETKYWKYVNRAYRKTQLMHPGEKFSIEKVCNKETEPLFRYLLTSFIHMHPGEYLFSNDYKYFIKVDSDRLEAARKIRQNSHRDNGNQGDGQTAGSDGIRPQTLHTPGKDLPDKKPDPQPGIRSRKTQIRAS